MFIEKFSAAFVRVGIKHSSITQRNIQMANKAHSYPSYPRKVETDDAIQNAVATYPKMEIEKSLRHEAVETYKVTNWSLIGFEEILRTLVKRESCC